MVFGSGSASSTLTSGTPAKRTYFRKDTSLQGGSTRRFNPRMSPGIRHWAFVVCPSTRERRRTFAAVARYDGTIRDEGQSSHEEEIHLRIPTTGGDGRHHRRHARTEAEGLAYSAQTQAVRGMLGDPG